MKCSAAFLVLSLVVLLAQPGEGFFHLIGHAIRGITSIFGGKRTKEQAHQHQLDQMQLDQKLDQMQLDQKLDQMQLDRKLDQQQLEEQQLEEQQKEQLDKRSLKDKFAQRRFN